MNDRILYIVTGTTRGIGLALTNAVDARGHLLFTISRAPDAARGNGHNYWCDLGEPDQIESTMSRLASDALRAPACRDLVLINNAGILAPIGAMDKVSAASIRMNMQINFLAPVQLTALFVRATDSFRGGRRVINISSGAARHPYAGWGGYCSAKAALDMATLCTALEQKDRANGVAVSAVAPGVVDTDMQSQIREADDARFPMRSRFIQMQASGGLASADSIAELLLDLDAGGQFDTGGLYDLRDVEFKGGLPVIAPRSTGA